MITIIQYGSVDDTFNAGTGLDLYTEQVFLDSDGKYVIVGDFTEYNGEIVKDMIRINYDGSLNTYQ